MKTFAKSYWDSFTPVGQFWLALGIGALIVDAAISFKYGWTQTGIHAAGFAMLAIFFAFLPDQAALMWERKKYFASLSMWAVTVCIGVMAYWSHVGYGAGVRVGDIQQTGVQNTIHKAVNQNLDSERANLDSWKKQLATLMEQNAWAATVKADGLRAQLATHDEAIRQEGKRGGCGPKCLSLKREKDKLEERIATIEQASDLTKRIEATQRILDTKLAKAEKTEFKSSSVVNQVSTAGQLYLAFSGAKPEDTLEPDRVTVSYANLIITAGGSLAFMLMAPIGFFIAGRNRKSDADIAEAAREIATAQAQSKPIILHETKTIHEKDPAWSRLVSNLQRQGLIPA